MSKVPRLIRTLYATVKELEEEFVDENRKFTPDGHLVGSIGEVVAAYSFGLTLYPLSTETHDAETVDQKKVQIKLTGGDRSVSLYSEPDYLIVLQLSNDKFRVAYNGPGEPVWSLCGLPAKNGQRKVSLRTLRRVQTEIPSAFVIPQVRPLLDLSVELPSDCAVSNGIESTENE